MQLSRKSTAVLASVAIGASSLVAAAPAASAQTGSLGGNTVQYAGGTDTTAAGTGAGSSDAGTGEGNGSMDDPLVQGALVIGAGLLVSGGLAIAAGIRGGAFPLPTIPGLNG